jgi:hypothetical protein
MEPLSNHPTVLREYRPREPGHTFPPPMTDEDNLQMHLRHLLSLDLRAVFHMVGGSTVVYYRSPHAHYESDEACFRIVLGERGQRLRMDRVGFDPRT